MSIIEKIKNRKKTIAALALGGALLTCAGHLTNKEYSKEPKANVTQVDKNTDQKIDYFAELMADIESGKDKNFAYQKFLSGITMENAKEIAKLQKQVEEMQQNQQKMANFLLLSMVVGATLLMKKTYFDTIFKTFTPFIKKENDNNKVDSSTNYKRTVIGFNTSRD